MKKLLILALISILCLSLFCGITGCGSSNDEQSMVNGMHISEMDDMLIFNQAFQLVYHPQTKIVYIVSVKRMAPYYSENGYLCRYIDGELVEVVN